MKTFATQDPNIVFWLANSSFKYPSTHTTTSGPTKTTSKPQKRTAESQTAKINGPVGDPP